ncbi:MAG TPA: hypothetical protein PLL57_14630, partial [Flavobacteriales bacterium]|nr:hypothetical protein [Flavobacteriales bacterium]
MRELILATLITASALDLTCTAQSPLFSTRKDVTGNGNSDFLSGLARTTNNDFLTFGLCAVTPTAVSGICVSRFSNDGAFISSHTFTDSISHIFLKRDGVSSWSNQRHAASVQWAEDASLWYFDAGGDSLWVRKPFAPVRPSKAGNTQHATNGDVLFCGTAEVDSIESTIFLARYDAAGLLQWLQEYPLPPQWQGMQVFVSSMAVLSDGGTVISGNRQDAFGENAQQWVLRSSANGSFQFLNDVEGPGEGDNAHAVSTTDDTYTVVGMRRQENPNAPGDYCCPRPYFSRFSNDGTLQWSRLFQGTRREFTDFALRTLNDGSVLSTGFTTHQYGSNAYLFNVSASGDSIWHREYSAPDSTCINRSYMPHTLLVESPNRIVLGGVVGLCGNDHWIMRTDGAGLPPSTM